MTYIFNVEPVAKPRMTRSDKWNEREVVMRYRAFADHLRLLSQSKKYILGSKLSIVFVLPMPNSWSEKKKLLMNGKPHQQKPDIDNLLKAFTDSLCYGGDDSHVYMVAAAKYWGYQGKIEVINE